MEMLKGTIVWEVVNEFSIFKPKKRIIGSKKYAFKNIKDVYTDFTECQIECQKRNLKTK